MKTKSPEHNLMAFFASGLLSLGLGLGPLLSAQEADPEVAPASVPVKDRAAEQMKMLAKSLPASQVVWLKEGDKDFLAVQTLARKPNPLGWVILLHDDGQHPSWPGTLTELQEYLPDRGWHTLAIALPEPFRSKVPPRPTADELAKTPSKDGEAIEPGVGANESNEIFNDATNSISDGSFTPDQSTTSAQNKEKQDTGKQESKALDRIISARSYIAQQDTQITVLFGQGLGATRAAHYLVEVGNTDGKVAALVLLDALNKAPGAETQITDALTNPRFPILDISTIQTRQSQEDALARQQQAQRKGLSAYRQTFVVVPLNDNVNRTIYGFLQQLPKR